MKVMGIDYGLKRTGIALSDESQCISVPLTSVKAESENVLLVEIEKIINLNNIKKIVVGIPLSLSGKATIQTKKTRNFVKILKGKIRSLDIPVIGFDERLTTKIAEIYKRDTRNKDIDAISASVILQNYLDKNINEKAKKIFH